MTQKFTNTHVLSYLGKIIVPWIILVPYLCSFATSHWAQAGPGGRHWGLWIVCSPPANNSSNSSADVCSYLQPGDGDAYFEAARAIAVFPLLCYILLLFQLSLMETVVLRGLLGTLIAITGALFNVVVLIMVALNYDTDSRWDGNQGTPFLSWSFWCALPPPIFSMLDGLVMGYSAHRRRYPYGKRSPRKRRHPANQRSVAEASRKRREKMASVGARVESSLDWDHIQRMRALDQLQRQQCRFQRHMDKLHYQQEVQRQLESVRN